MTYTLKRISAIPKSDKMTQDVRMRVLEAQLVNGGNMFSREFDDYFQAQEEKAAPRHTATKEKLQANTAIGMCRRARTGSNLPASINGRKGITRDISSSGLYLVQGSEHEIGSRIECAIDLDTPGSNMKLCCQGIVVRIEKINDKFGIGVKILSQTTMHYN